MEYYEAANALLDRRRRFPPRPGTAATAALLDHLGGPHEELQVVQIAGSNGKGSTARMLESVCRADGRRVGLYTSPHFDDLRERIQVDGRRIPKSAVVEFVEAVEPYLTEAAATGSPVTFFEATTALAYWWFASREVDLAVVEVGIGGRHDATSVVDPVASAVTGVALEHTDVLGETLPEIARDLATVAPTGGDRSLVTAASGDGRDALAAAVDAATTVGSEPESNDVVTTYHGPDELEGVVDIIGSDWRVTGARLPLLGRHQARNAGVAAALARQLGCSTDRIVEGLRGSHWPGRFEVVSRSPLVVLDGAHNPDACAELGRTLADLDHERLHLVLGALADKDLSGMVDALPTPDRAIACQPDRDRAAGHEVVAAALSATEDVSARRAVGDAVGDALAAAEPDDCVLVTGSLHTVGEARQRWTSTYVPTRTPDVDAAAAVLDRSDVTRAGIGRMRAKGVHRTVRTRLRRRQAEYLKQTLLGVGGECAVSGIDDREEPCEVVLMGTLEQLARTATAIADQHADLRRVAGELRAAIGADPGEDAPAPSRPIGPPTTPTEGLPWDAHPAVMGILNVTPDSFHDGGEHDSAQAAVSRAETLVDEGAAIVDVGGESTRPGADPVPPAEQIDRIVPVIERIADLDAAISVDTRSAEVAAAALDVGADLLNDVSGLEDPAMAHLAAERDVPLVVMHSIDTPVGPETDPAYDDVVDDVRRELESAVVRAERAGLDRKRIVVDPGLGFGKTAAESFALLDRLDELRAIGCSVLVGHSHKSMFDRVGYGPDERRDVTVGATALAAERGADVVRVHDVSPNRAAIRAVTGATNPGRFDPA
jgi:dihydropteroate synthase